MRQVTVSLVSLLLSAIALTSLADTLEVEVFEPQQETHNLTIELSGSVVPEQDAQLATLEAGLVKALYVEAGDKVIAGQALLSLDDTLAKLRLSQEKADQLATLVQLQEAQRQYDEVVSLAKSKVIADSLLAERKANLASAQSRMTNSRARVALQKEIVKRHTLIAPFDGVIAQRNVNLGEWINQQSQIFQLVSSHSLRVIVDLPQEHLSAISNKSDVIAMIISDVMPDQQYELPLTSIVAVSEPSSRTMQIRIDLPRNTGMIPGMSARARFSLSDENDTLSWLPRTALKQHPDGSHSVFTIHTDNRASDKANGVKKIKRRKITLIKSDMDRVAVTGLPLNPLVVVSGTELLKDNQTVIPVSADSVSSAPASTKTDDNKGSR